MIYNIGPLNRYISKRFASIVGTELQLTFWKVPSQWSNAGNHEYCGRGHRTRYIPQGVPNAPTKLRKRDQTDTKKLKKTVSYKEGFHI
ncbi:unnamed protein product [Protopolystoma xenopodis]|uniref:Uncharacterized protein n=1 Tax=Protopolystoma xenopodis TaxID=117903 RepID=A0A3S5AQK2_9PLAT|nr:unnamed protein product [Protopolystoma xenopodis]